jgi:outer membrane protein TolC
VAVANADLDLSMQAFNQQAVLNDVLFSASLAYMEWLSAMQQLDVYRQLLNNAKARQTALEKRIKLGFSAKIDLLDNEQNVLKRQALVLKAENDLRMRTAALSLYWRDASGKPKMVSSEQPTMPNTVAETALDNVTQLITHAITSHPDIQYVDNQILQHKNNRKLFENALLPKVDVVMKASRDFGSGSQTREGFETYVGLEFSMPLEQRKSKGKLNKTQAKLRELGYLRQRLIEELKLVLHQAKMKYTNAQAQATISLRRSDIATQLMQQEQERFNQGDSDIFKLNLREEDTAEAKIDAITAELQQILTRIELLGQAYKIDDLLPSF